MRLFNRILVFNTTSCQFKPKVKSGVFPDVVVLQRKGILEMVALNAKALSGEWEAFFVCDHTFDSVNCI